MYIDPTLTVETQTGKLVVMCAINSSDNKPYALVVKPTTGELMVNAKYSMKTIVVAKTIGSITFIGAGLNDMSNSGEYTGDVDKDYIVEIDLAAATDTFKWSDDGGLTWTPNIPITGTPQTLSYGIVVKFTTITGHTLGDKWEFTCRAADPTAFHKTSQPLIAVSIAPLASFTSPTVDLSQTRSGVLTVMGAFNALAVLGMKVEIFTSPDGVNWDTQAWASTGLEPVLVAGSTEQKSSNLETLPRYMRVKVTDLEKGIGSLYVTFTGIKE